MQAPELLDCIIDTTPAWQPVLEALANLKGGGRLVINAIRKEDADKNLLLELDYLRHLWLQLRPPPRWVALKDRVRRYTHGARVD